MLRASQGGPHGLAASAPLMLALVGGLAASAVAFNSLRGRSRRSMSMRAPTAAKRPHTVKFGKVDGENRGKNPMNPPMERVDDYFWMRDDNRDSKEVMGHIESENAFTQAHMSHLGDLREDLYKEFLGHMKETDTQAPYRYGPFLYYTRTVKGKSYKIHCRSMELGGLEQAALPGKWSQELLDSLSNFPVLDYFFSHNGCRPHSCTSTFHFFQSNLPAHVYLLQLVLDENEEAKGKEYYDISDVSPSPGDHRLAAYAADTTGYETYDIRFRDVATGKDLDDVITKTSGNVCWGADSSTVFYTTQDDEHRPYKMWMHILGTPQSEATLPGKWSQELLDSLSKLPDRLLFTEEDQVFWMGITKTDSERFLMMKVSSKTTGEIHFIDLQGVSGTQGHLPLNLRVLAPREEGVRYSAEHWGDEFYIVTNKDGCKNSKLVSVPFSSPGSENWKDVMPYDPSVSLTGVLSFKNYLVLGGREKGLCQLWVRDMRTRKMHRLEHPEEAYTCYATNNFVYDTDVLRFGYQSMISPKAVFDYNMKTREKTFLKETEVPLYDRSLYVCERRVAKARDGVEVPMSLVYRKDIYPKGISGSKAPCMLYGYGSYGHAIEPGFDFTRLSFLDRGMVYVIAHIRGGGEMGRPWYEDSGKFLTKRNTFQDFVDCAEQLVVDGVTSPDVLAICGRSAGGLLMGNVVNMRPDLFKAVVADVPFVDLMNTMADPSIPLTITEWEEWGNPNEMKFFDYMLSYSPYDNVRRQPYPAMLVTGGLNDPRVAYWEPCKWVAKIRDMSSTKNPLYLKIDMSAGHFSASDRYKHLKEQAFEYAFVLDTLGCKGLVLSSGAEDGAVPEAQAQS